MKTLKFILLSTFLTFMSTLYVNAQIVNPTGYLTESGPDDIWAHTLEGSHFNEFWNYQFYLNDNITLYITFSVANFGSLKSAVSGLQMSVLNLNNEVYQLSREYNLDHLVQDRDRYMFRNRMEREIYFEGKLPETHRIRINTTKDGVSYDIDLNLHNILQGFVWDDGRFQIGNEEVGIITHIPYAEVEGMIDIDGTRKAVSGSAYMDHTFQNQTTTRLIDSGFRFVNHQDNENWDLYYFMLPDKSEENATIGYRLKNRNGNVRVHGIEKITRLEEQRVFNEDIAELLEIELSNGEKVQIVRTVDIEKFSVLSELSRIARGIAKRFLGGEVIHFRGQANLEETGHRPISGHYNYFIVD